MNTVTRNCQYCACFNSAPSNGGLACWNLVSVIEFYGTPAELVLKPGPSDLCRRHQTREEDADETAFIGEHRDELMTAIFRNANQQERREQGRADPHAAETSADRITRAVLLRLEMKS